MNVWQKIFCVFGIVATIVLGIFPPQIIPNSAVQFMVVTKGYAIDWFRLFLWFCAIVIITGLGIAINKEEHK